MGKSLLLVVFLEENNLNKNGQGSSPSHINVPFSRTSDKP